MAVLSNLRALAKALMRRSAPVAFGDLNRVQPVSRDMGWARGTPIDRRYIDAFLTEQQSLISGSAVEVAEARYIRQYGSNVRQQTILAPAEGIAHPDSRTAVLIADLAMPETVPEAQFDTFVCTQTYNFIYEARTAIASSRRLLREGGHLIGTVAGFSQVSRYDADRWGDYWRFSEAAVRRMLGEAFDGEPITRVYGNALASQALIQGLAVEDLPDAALLDHEDPDYPIIIGFVARA